MHTGDALDDNFELSGDEEDDEEGSAEEGDSEGDDELNATDAKSAAQAAGDHPLQQSFQAAVGIPLAALAGCRRAERRP